jgi:hypothetical protein
MRPVDFESFEFSNGEVLGFILQRSWIIRMHSIEVLEMYFLLRCYFVARVTELLVKNEFQIHNLPVMR